MIDNILNWFERATAYDLAAGKAWYPAARLACRQLADEAGIDYRRVVYAVAALSPQMKWERNVAACRAVINGATSFPGAYSANIEKALHILFDDTDWERWLQGPKVTSFAANILGEADVVTVDTWAWRIAQGDDLWAKPTQTTLAKRYDELAEEYRQAAAQVGLTARELQAVTWTTVRRIANGRVGPQQLALDI